jgi:hypothetical protein
MLGDPVAGADGDELGLVLLGFGVVDDLGLEEAQGRAAVERARQVAGQFRSFSRARSPRGSAFGTAAIRAWV